MNTIRRAIRQKKRITAHYTPIREGAIGERTLEPHALGYSRKGHLLLRAWVNAGVSRSYPLVNSTNRPNQFKKRWRLFRVDNLSNINLTPELFTTRPHYNEEGDKAMERILERVPRPASTRQRTRRTGR
jgi:predicted DNA-binding transcriptional regulator YafY